LLIYRINVKTLWRLNSVTLIASRDTVDCTYSVTTHKLLRFSRRNGLASDGGRYIVIRSWAINCTLITQLYGILKIILHFAVRDTDAKGRAHKELFTRCARSRTACTYCY
jgi:hypothetical protein